MTSYRGLVLLVLPTAVAGQTPAPAFPLIPGQTWQYGGSARWAGPNQTVDSGRIQWTMKILAVRDGSTARGALVRGWIQELAWYHPGRSPGYSLLLARGRRLYHVAAYDSATALDTLERALAPGAPLPQGAELIVDSALTVGHLYGQSAERGDRPDTFYAWYVESRDAIPARPGWSLDSATVVQWRLVYRTMPDHQFLDLVPGLGITHYVYGHHGTVADSDVTLMSARQAP